MFQLSEKAPRWIVFCSSMRKWNVLEVRRKAPHSSSQGTNRRKEERRHSEDRRSTIKFHLRQSKRDPKDVHCNRTKRKQNSESSSFTGRRKPRHLLHCTFNLAQTLQLPTTHQRLSISHIGSEDKTDKCYSKMPITLKTNEGLVHLKAIVVPKICTPKVRQPYQYKKEEQLKDQPFVEPVNEGREIDLFIASDFYYSVVKVGIIRVNNGTVAVETKVGYLVCGSQHNAPQIDSYFTTTQNALIVTDKEHIKEPQQLFEWIKDESDVCRTHDYQLDDFLQTLVQIPETGQKTASLPLTPERDKSKIPTNRHIAYHRARNMIEKMSTDKQPFQKMKEIFCRIPKTWIHQPDDQLQLQRRQVPSILACRL